MIQINKITCPICDNTTEEMLQCVECKKFVCGECFHDFRSKCAYCLNDEYGGY